MGIVNNGAASRRSRATRDSLLAAAAQILETGGLEQLNTNALAKAAGVTVPTVYRNFSNKEDVLVALARTFIRAEKSWLKDAEAEFHSAQELATAVSLLIDLYWSSARTYPGIVPLRAAMRVWPDLREVEEESLASSAQWLAVALRTRYTKLTAGQSKKIARHVVETVCAAVDRCYALPKSEQRWRIDALKKMLVVYLASMPGVDGEAYIERERNVGET